MCSEVTVNSLGNPCSRVLKKKRHSLSLASIKTRLVLPFWYQLTWVVPDKGQLTVVGRSLVSCFLLTHGVWISDMIWYDMIWHDTARRMSTCDWLSVCSVWAIWTCDWLSVCVCVCRVASSCCGVTREAGSNEKPTTRARHTPLLHIHTHCPCTQPATVDHLHCTRYYYNWPLLGYYYNYYY